MNANFRIQLFVNIFIYANYAMSPYMHYTTYIIQNGSYSYTYAYTYMHIHILIYVELLNSHVYIYIIYIHANLAIQYIDFVSLYLYVPDEGSLLPKY